VNSDGSWNDVHPKGAVVIDLMEGEGEGMVSWRMRRMGIGLRHWIMSRIGMGCELITMR
jgi:hypothetical protein